MERNKIKGMRFRRVVQKLYSSIYKRIHSWGLFLLLVLLYASSMGLKSPALLEVFGWLGLMSLHVLSGFGLVLAFVIISYNYLQRRFFPLKSAIHLSSAEQNLQQTGGRFLVNLAFYSMLMLVCCLGLIYYFAREFSFASSFLHQSTVSLMHVIAGWFFLSLVFIKYYLSLMHWFRELVSYLRE